MYVGATVDITVYETTVGCNIKELGRTIRADCGGIAVENGFMQFFANILGKPRLDLLKQEDMSDYLDFIREIESVKQLFTTRTPRKGKITINMPWYTFCSLRETNSLKDFSTVLESTYASSVSIRHNKIIIDEELFEDIFENAIQSILELLHNMFERLEFRTVTSICLVGGFSKCELVRSAIRKAFPTKRILMPDDATLNGAVLYGHQSGKISFRFTFSLFLAVVYARKKKTTRTCSAIFHLDTIRLLKRHIITFIFKGLYELQFLFNNNSFIAKNFNTNLMLLFIQNS